jgi:hypothetical protein
MILSFQQGDASAQKRIKWEGGASKEESTTIDKFVNHKERVKKEIKGII